jgi:hypothetical protein
VTLYRNGCWAWEDIDQLSSRWLQQIKDNDVLTSSQVVAEPGHSLVFTLHKNRSYILGTMALAWSSLYTEDTTNYAWLIMLQRSGHIVIWKAQTPFTNVSFSAYHDLQIVDPSIVKVHPGPAGMTAFKEEKRIFNNKNKTFLISRKSDAIVCWISPWPSKVLDTVLGP